jgi:hypothetical protein
MGIKELKYLKKSLSDINHNESLMEEKKSNLLILNRKTKSFKDRLNQEKEIKVSPSLKRNIKDLEKAVFNTKKSILEGIEEQNINVIKNQIDDIENEILNSGKLRTKRDTSVFNENGLIILGIIFLQLLWLVLMVQNSSIEVNLVVLFLVPFTVYSILSHRLDSLLKAEMVDSEIIKNLNDLIEGQKNLKAKFSYQKRNLKSNETRMEKLIKNLEKQKLDIASDIELAKLNLERHSESIRTEKQKIKDLSTQNQEIYESIKHLIPYSDYV